MSGHRFLQLEKKGVDVRVSSFEVGAGGARGRAAIRERQLEWSRCFSINAPLQAATGNILSNSTGKERLGDLFNSTGEERLD